MSIIKILFGKQPKEKPLPTHSVEDLKQIVKILFVDDSSVKMADWLEKKDGWRNVTKIKDVSSLSQKEVREAHIIFVDIQGVGKAMNFKEEGLELIVALKERYPEKKIVMYSAESNGQIDAFHKAGDLVDGRLRKSADLYEFSTMTERLAKDAFCFDNCVLHICEVLRKELKVEKSKTEVERVVKQIYNDNLYEDKLSIAEAFNLSNVGSVASIIQLLLIPISK